MNKQELISAAAEKTGFSKKDTEATVTAVLETIISALEDNEKVQPRRPSRFPLPKPLSSSPARRSRTFWPSKEPVSCGWINT